MAGLEESAGQFAKALVAQDVVGVMAALTPNGMMKAMALQGAQRPQATGATVELKGRDGEDELVDLHLQTDTGEAVVSTRWKEVAGAWRVDDLVLKA